MATRAVVFREKKEQLIILIPAVFIVVTLLALYLPAGIDWNNTYRPAARALLAGESPYEAVEIYFAAPWTLIPLVPMALLPPNIGRAVLFLISLIAFGYAAHQLGARPIALVAFLMSPPVLHCLLNANVEWMPVLGFVLPPQIGLFFIAVKPQIGFVVGLFWLVESWRTGGFREAVRVFLPVTVALLISLLLFGLWPLRWQTTMLITQGYNASLWPMTLPVGLALIVSAIRTREIRYALPAAPCLSPYVLLHAWSGALVSLAPHTYEMLAAVAGLWGIVLIRVLAG